MTQHDLLRSRGAERALTRRDWLERCLQHGGLLLAAPLSAAFAADALADPLAPTATQVLGPFYKRLAPNQRQLRQPGDAGVPLVVAGRVFSETGALLPDASVELWQADSNGLYDVEGYRYRAALVPDEHAAYGIDTVMPGGYGRAQHIHFLVRAEGHEPLVTQLYFATDPLFEGDPAKNFVRDLAITTPDLVRPVTLAAGPGAVMAKVDFDLVLEKAR